jgi:hypothetical protein
VALLYRTGRKEAHRGLTKTGRYLAVPDGGGQYLMAGRLSLARRFWRSVLFTALCGFNKQYGLVKPLKALLRGHPAEFRMSVVIGWFRFSDDRADKVHVRFA